MNVRPLRLFPLPTFAMCALFSMLVARPTAAPADVLMEVVDTQREVAALECRAARLEHRRSERRVEGLRDLFLQGCASWCEVARAEVATRALKAECDALTKFQTWLGSINHFEYAAGPVQASSTIVVNVPIAANETVPVVLRLSELNGSAVGPVVDYAISTADTDAASKDEVEAARLRRQYVQERLRLMRCDCDAADPFFKEELRLAEEDFNIAAAQLAALEAVHRRKAIRLARLKSIDVRENRASLRTGETTNVATWRMLPASSSTLAASPTIVNVSTVLTHLLLLSTSALPTIESAALNPELLDWLLQSERKQFLAEARAEAIRAEIDYSRNLQSRVKDAAGTAALDDEMWRAELQFIARRLKQKQAALDAQQERMARLRMSKELFVAQCERRIEAGEAVAVAERITAGHTRAAAFESQAVGETRADLLQALSRARYYHADLKRVEAVVSTGHMAAVELMRARSVAAAAQAQFSSAQTRRELAQLREELPNLLAQALKRSQADRTATIVAGEPR